MKDIKDLLKKYLSFELQDKELIDCFTELVKDNFSIELDKKDFKIEGKKIILKFKKPKEKSFILINKTAILDKLNDRGFIDFDIN